MSAPAAPRCRWCRARLRVLLTPGVADYCEAGCAPVESAPTVAQCDECGVEFRTGLPMMRAILCEPCDARERAAYEASYAEAGESYHFEPFKRGGYR